MGSLIFGMIPIPMVVMWGTIVLLLTAGVIAAFIFARSDEYEYEYDGGGNPAANPADSHEPAVFFFSKMIHW